jgi:hypothetical protein
VLTVKQFLVFCRRDTDFVRGVLRKSGINVGMIMFWTVL